MHNFEHEGPNKEEDVGKGHARPGMKCNGSQQMEGEWLRGTGGTVTSGLKKRWMWIVNVSGAGSLGLS